MNTTIVLPVVLQIDAWQGFVFGLICVAVAIWAIRMAMRSYRSNGPTGGTIAGGALAMALIVLGTGIGLRHVGWRLRLDETGIALKAPLDVLMPSSRIAWADIASVRLVERSYRGGISYRLNIAGIDGTAIELANADHLPKQFAAVFAELIATRMPSDRRERIRFADFDTSQIQPHGWAIGDHGYTAHDGAGATIP